MYCHQFILKKYYKLPNLIKKLDKKEMLRDLLKQLHLVINITYQVNI